MNDVRKLPQKWRDEAMIYLGEGTARNAVQDCASELEAALAAQSAEPVASIVRDVCELPPADPDAAETVCIRVSDLQAIAERYTHPTPATGEVARLREALDLLAECEPQVRWAEQMHLSEFSDHKAADRCRLLSNRIAALTEPQP